MFTLRNSPSPSGPTTLSASQRTNPPGIATVIPGWPASSAATRSPLVTTVRCSQPPRALRWRVMARLVVLASMAMLSPSTTMDAASRPIAFFSARWSRSRTSNARSAPARDAATAPPWVRTSRPACSRAARSLRIVTLETRNRADRSVTRARPCSSISRAMSCCRSSAKTSVRFGSIDTGVPGCGCQRGRGCGSGRYVKRYRTVNNEVETNRKPKRRLVRVPLDGGAARTDEEIEVRSRVRLEHVVDVQPLPATGGVGIGRGGGLAGRPACELLVGHVERQPAARHIQLDPVAVPDEGERSAGGRLRRHVEHDRPVRGAAHPAVAYADHVPDARGEQLGRQRQVRHLR